MNRRHLGSAIVVLVFVVVAAGAWLALEEFGIADRLRLAMVSPSVDMRAATFPVCGAGRRITCMVDGDTFWLDGVKIRIADIDAPELSPPRCEAERIKGEAAKRRLQELLNAGAFSLVGGVRNEDRYGRQLRTVTRNGRSIGETLVAERLARRWDGSRHPWCD